MPRSKGWCAYILRCSDGTLYCGATNDLAARVVAHNAGRAARYTRGRAPVSVTFVKRAASRSEALRIEAMMKRMTRRQKLTMIAERRNSI